MGYDMYRELAADEREEDWAKEYLNLKATWWNLPDREATRAALDRCNALEREHGVYFRLNIFGMGRYREAMARIGMVFSPQDGAPDFPRPERFGLASYPDEEAGDLSPAERSFLDQVKAVTDGPCMEETPGIPVYKLGSNDGWLVLPVEIRSALTLYHAAGCPVGDDAEPDYWAQWIEFLMRSADSGGFRVH